MPVPSSGKYTDRQVFFTFLGLAFLAAGTPAVDEPVLTPHILSSIQNEIDTVSSWVLLPVIVDAVRSQNAENVPMNTILTRDSAWTAITGSQGRPSPLMEQLCNNPAGKWLRERRKSSNGKYRECFLCDGRGALVASSHITSDYFQGDEAKWIGCFNSGRGSAVHADPQYDTSADAVLLQISVPVADEGRTIGVLVVGVRFSAIR